MGEWGGFWGQGPQQIYGRTGPNFGNLTQQERYQRYFGTPNEQDKLFWQEREGMPFAYARYMNQEARPDSHYGRWLEDQEGWMTANFVDASRQNPTLQWSQYLADQAENLARRYTELPGWQQGKNPASGWAGRRL